MFIFIHYPGIRILLLIYIIIQLTLHLMASVASVQQVCACVQFIKLLLACESICFFQRPEPKKKMDALTGYWPGDCNTQDFSLLKCLSLKGKTIIITHFNFGLKFIAQDYSPSFSMNDSQCSSLTIHSNDKNLRLVV